MNGNETVKKEDLLEIANWIMEVAEQSSFAHDELKALHYADTVRGAADQAETLRCAVGELDQCHWNLKTCSKMLRERNAQIEALRLQIPKHGEWVWIHKESTRLADRYDYICVEGINYKDMARGLKLAKATNDNSFGQFRSMLAYKMAERGKKLITIDKWFPSSKMCRFCGTINSELTLKDREWDCACGAHLLRDHNAAINIREEGLRNAT